MPSTLFIPSATTSPSICAGLCSRGGRGGAFICKELPSYPGNPKIPECSHQHPPPRLSLLLPCAPRAGLPDRVNSPRRVTRLAAPRPLTGSGSVGLAIFGHQVGLRLFHPAAEEVWVRRGFPGEWGCGEWGRCREKAATGLVRKGHWGVRGLLLQPEAGTPRRRRQPSKAERASSQLNSKALALRKAQLPDQQPMGRAPPPPLGAALPAAAVSLGLSKHPVLPPVSPHTQWPGRDRERVLRSHSASGAPCGQETPGAGLPENQVTKGGLGPETCSAIHRGHGPHVLSHFTL